MDVREIVTRIMGPFEYQMQENIRNMFSQARMEVKEYKTTFNTNLKELNNRIDVIIAEIQEKVLLTS